MLYLQVIVVFICNYALCLYGISGHNVKPINEAIDSFSTYQIGLVRFFDGLTGEEVTPRAARVTSLDRISVQLTFSNLTFNIDLILNRQLLSVNCVQKSVNRTGQHRHRIDQTSLMCYYTGNVRDVPGSVAAFSICRGVEGFFMTDNETYHIEPVKMRETTNSYEKAVVVYRGSDSTVEPGRCGMNGTATSHNHIGVNSRERRSNDYLHHLRSKRSTSFMWPEDLDGTVSVVELYLVNSYGQFARMNRNPNTVIQRSISIVNVVNSLYQPINITFVIVGIEVWTDADRINITLNSSDTLSQFLAYRNTSINPQHRNDNAQLITNLQFTGSVVGLAPVGTMCSYQNSGGINSDVNSLVAYVGTSMAHEIGHNFGQNHDGNQCQCGDPTKYCIMYYISNVNGVSTQWSQCSMDTFNKGFHEGIDICLHNVPNSIYNTTAVCGNGLVEQGEQCDCGNFSQTQCNSSCCNAKTCQLVGNAACAYGRCCNISTCQIKTGSVQCRQAASSCDVPEYCDGVSPLCPADVFVFNGTSCVAANANAYCYNGQCLSQLSACQLLWGSSSQVSDARCYNTYNVGGNVYGHCGWNRLNNSYTACAASDVLCGLLQCSSETTTMANYAKGAVLYILPDTLSSAPGQINKCYAVKFDLAADVTDPSMAPNGANCGTNKMCVNQRCVDVAKVYTTACTPSTCNNHGICNSLGQCHCDPGFSPPYCNITGCGGSTYSSPAGCNVVTTSTRSTTATSTTKATGFSLLPNVTSLSPNFTDVALTETTPVYSTAFKTSGFNRLLLAVGFIIAVKACFR